LAHTVKNKIDQSIDERVGFEVEGFERERDWTGRVLRDYSLFKPNLRHT
jgi:hypothetical protein